MNRRKGAILAATLGAVTIGGLVVVSQPRIDAASVATVGQDPLSLATDAHAGHAFVVNLNDSRTTGTVTMLTLTNGTVQRTIPVGHFPRGIVVDEGRARAFVINSAAPWLSEAASMSILDTQSGRERGRTPLGDSPSFVGIDRRAGRVLAGMPYGHMDGRVQIVDVTTGRVVRTVTLGFNPRAMAVDEQRGRALVIGSDRAYAGRLAVLDTHTGHLLRDAKLGGFASSAIAVDTRGGHTFVATVAGSGGACVTPGRVCHTPGTITIRNTSNGRALRSVAVGDNPSTIVVDERTQRVFVVNTGTNEGDVGTVSVLDAVTGHLVRTTTLGHEPTGAAVDTRRGRVYVANSTSNTVSVLDARSGQLLGAIPVVGGPAAVAVDESTGHVFVSSNDVSSDTYLALRHSDDFFGKIGFYSTELTNKLRILRKGRTGTVSMFDAQKIP